jgi:hypothetical protein
MPRTYDPDLLDLRARIGAEEYAKTYRNVYQKTTTHGERRFSGKHYKNSAEKLQALREKYKNGVPEGTIELMLEL